MCKKEREREKELFLFYINIIFKSIIYFKERYKYKITPISIT